MGAGLAEYLTRALSHQAAIAEPKDLAWLLASYARDGLSRVEAHRLKGDDALASVEAVCSALEEGARRSLRGRAGTKLFPLHPRADALLWRVLRLGALGAANPSAYGEVQLA